MESKKRPPYARTIRPGTRDLRAIVGCWDTARMLADHERPVVLLPPGDEPAAYDWRCCAGADVLVLWRVGEAAPESVHRLAVALIRAGAILAVSVETTGDPSCPIRSYRPLEVRHAA